MRILGLYAVYYGCAAYGLVNPVFGILFYIHITIFRPESLAWGSPVFGRVHLITSLCVVVGYLFRQHSDQVISNVGFQKTNLYIFSIFALWLFVVSVLAEYSVWLSMDVAALIAKIFGLCFLFSRLITTEKRL